MTNLARPRWRTSSVCEAQSSRTRATSPLCAASRSFRQRESKAVGTIAPCSCRMISSDPLVRAFSSGVWPRSSLAMGSAFCAMSRLTIWGWPNRAAMCSGVAPRGPAQFTSKPSPNRVLTASTSPARAPLKRAR